MNRPSLSKVLAALLVISSAIFAWYAHSLGSKDWDKAPGIVIIDHSLAELKIKWPNAIVSEFDPSQLDNYFLPFGLRVRRAWIEKGHGAYFYSKTLPVALPFTCKLRIFKIEFDDQEQADKCLDLSVTGSDKAKIFFEFLEPHARSIRVKGLCNATQQSIEIPLQ